MKNITDENRQFIQEKILEPFKLMNAQVAIEKLYWHLINGFYDRDIVCTILVESLSIKPEIAKEISLVLTHDLAKDPEAVGANNVIGEEREISTSAEVGEVESSTKVQPMRTMAEDMQKVHGYGVLAAAAEDGAATPDDDDTPTHKSEQTSVLQRPPAANTPTYSEPSDTTKATSATESKTKPPAPAAPATEPETESPAPAASTNEDQPEDTRWHSSLDS